MKISSTIVIVLSTTLSSVRGGVIGVDLTPEPMANGTDLASRAADKVDDSYFNTPEFKDWIPRLDLTKYCGGVISHWTSLEPAVSPAPKIMHIKICYDRPLKLMLPLTFDLDDTCTSDHMWYTDHTQLGALADPAKTEDVLTGLRVSKCVSQPRGCWGEWLKEPKWDYQWIVQVPANIMTKYNKGQTCGAVFDQAVREACKNPNGYETVKFDCKPNMYGGSELRFRHDRLCGKTRIQDAISKASGGELKYNCPYFVEVPVPN
jgi:hypothetical protein